MKGLGNGGGLRGYYDSSPGPGDFTNAIDRVGDLIQPALELA